MEEGIEAVHFFEGMLDTGGDQLAIEPVGGRGRRHPGEVGALERPGGEDLFQLGPESSQER